MAAHSTLLCICRSSVDFWLAAIVLASLTRRIIISGPTKGLVAVGPRDCNMLDVSSSPVRGCCLDEGECFLCIYRNEEKFQNIIAAGVVFRNVTCHSQSQAGSTVSGQLMHVCFGLACVKVGSFTRPRGHQRIRQDAPHLIK